MTATRRLPAVGAALLLASCSSTSSAPSPQVSAQSGAAPQTTAQTRAPTTSPAPEPTAEPTAPKPPVPAPPPLVVHIRDFAYRPAAPVVVVGQRIEIINDDTAAHTWSAAPDGGWKYTSGNLEKGSRATFPGFAKPAATRSSVTTTPRCRR